VGLDYSNLAIGLMRGYLEQGNPTEAARIARTLPVNDRYRQNIRAIVDAADSLRASGEYEAVIPLYREIEKVVSEEAKPNVRMWLAYCLVLADRIEEADPMIDALEEPSPEQRLFSLYLLLKGSRQHSSGNYNEALDLLTRGFVRAQASYDWVPEMLYLIGDCYARSAENTAARNVWTEVVVLYPDSPWAAPAKSSLAALPEPEQSLN
jgi:tetratricopeptide (TPR) repeat protein